MGRSKEIWKDPLAFIPERFESGKVHEDTFAYVPFSAGKFLINIHQQKDQTFDSFFNRTPQLHWPKVCNAGAEKHNFKGLTTLQS